VAPAAEGNGEGAAGMSLAALFCFHSWQPQQPGMNT